MAQLSYRANLGAAYFPLISSDFGNSVILKQADQNFVPNVNSNEDPDKDIGIPQIYYGHNVMPYGQGLMSVGYVSKIPALSGTEERFLNVFTIRDDSGNSAYLSITGDGRIFVALSPGFVWIETFAPVPSSDLAGREVYVAHVSGTSYIYLANLGCFEYDFGTNTVLSVTLTGLTASDIIGICASSGYLIAWSTSEIAWSSTIDPTDFTPSLATGAGGGAPEGARGDITFCAEHNLGFILYTSTNAVAVIYSGNSRFPFNFREIVSSGGCDSQELVDVRGSNGVHWAYTTYGLQQIAPNDTSTPLSEITDFISGQVFEDYDTATDTLVKTRLSIPMLKKLCLVSSRYLVISYGVNELSHAIVYDIAMKRLGKLKISHVDCFEYKYFGADAEAGRQGIAFLQKTGKVVILDLRNSIEPADAVLILGKYRHARSRDIQLQTIAISSITTTSNFSVIDRIFFNDNTFYDFPMVQLSKVGDYRTYGSSRDGASHALICKKSFRLNNLELNYVVTGGDR